MRIPMASMLEGFVSQLLADYLSNYVKGIHPEQFRLRIWTGVAQLENVELRLEAFDYLQLPFAMKKGVVGKLKLHVPWTKLGREPILIGFEDVFICACPQDEFEWSSVALEARSLAAKKAKLAAAELAKLSARISQHVSDDNSSQSFLSHLSVKIIDNVQVTAHNVHFRYIGKKTDPQVAFSFGITFTCLTINNDYTFPGTSSGKLRANQVNKVMEIKELAAYWNSDETDLASFSEEFDAGLCSVLLAEQKRIYLVHPFDISLRFMGNKNSLFDGSSPQCSVALDINNLSFTVEDRQLHEMLLVWDSLTICKMREKYGHCRPAAGHQGYNRKENGWQKVWWSYAIQAVLIDVRKSLRRNSWNYLEWRMNMRRQYVELYEVRLDCLRKGKPAAHQNLYRLEELERELDLDEILSFRSVAEDRLYGQGGPQFMSDDNLNVTDFEETVHELKSDDQPLQKQRSWLNFLSLGMLGAAGSTLAGHQFAAVLPDEIIEDIYEATKYHPMGLKRDKDLPKGHYHIGATLHMGRLSVTLRGLCPKVDITTTEIQGIEASLKMWHKSANFLISIEELEAVDLCERSSTFPIILGSKRSLFRYGSEGGLFRYGSEGGVPQPQYKEAVLGVRQKRKRFVNFMSGSDCVIQSKEHFNKPLILVEIELLTEDKEFDMIVKIQTQPVVFAYSPKLVKNISTFLSRPTSLQTLKESMLSSLNKLQNPDARMQSKAELVLTMRKRISLKAEILSPVLIFSENLHAEDCTHLVILLESVHITSTKQPSISLLDRKFDGLEPTASAKCDKNGAAKEHWFGGMAYASLYNQFQLQLCNIQVLLTTHAYSWQECLNNQNQVHRLHLAELFDANILFEISALSDEPTLTRFKINGSFPGLTVLLSPRKWKALKSLFADYDEHDGVPAVDDALRIQAMNSVICETIPSGAGELEIPEREACSFKTSHGLANLELSIQTKILNLNFQLLEDESSASAYEKGILLEQGEHASLLFVHTDSQQELQFMVDLKEVEATIGQLIDSPFMTLKSASHLSVMATFLPTIMWKFECVAFDWSIILRTIPSPEEQTAVAHFKDMEFSGLVRNNGLDALACKVQQLWIHSSESHSDSIMCPLDCQWPTSRHSCLLYTCKQQCCHHEDEPTTAIQPGLEINVSRGLEMDRHVLVSIPLVIVCLHLTAWTSAIRALSQYVDTFMSSELINANAATQKKGHYSSAPPVAEDGCLPMPLKDSFDSGHQISKDLAMNFSDGTVFFKSSTIDVCFIVPELDLGALKDQKSNMPRSFVCKKCLQKKVEVKDAVSKVDTEKELGKLISCKMTLQVNDMVYDCSTFHYEAYILKIEGSLNPGNIDCSCGLPLIQIADVHIKGRINLKSNKNSEVTAAVIVKRVDIWCSYAILCFLRSFEFENYKSSDPILSLEANICATLQQGSFLLTDGRWNCNAPVLELRIQNTNIETTWKTDNFDFQGSSEIEADYNNMEKVTWEPLLELWKVSWNVSRTTEPRKRMFQTNSRISSPCQLNVNITKAFLEAAARANSILSDALYHMNDQNVDCNSDDHGSSKETNVSLGHAPYWLQNDTGVSIAYWLLGASRHEDDDSLEGKDLRGSSHNIVLPGCTIPLYIEETPDQLFRKSRINSSSERLADKRTSSGHHRMICVQIEGTARASPPMSIDLVGSKFFSITFSHSSSVFDEMRKLKERQQVTEKDGIETSEGDARQRAFSTPVVCEVSALQYSKIIRICATVSLVNATSIKMEVRFDIPFGIQPKVMEPILPGQVIPLPVHLAETGQIRWRPVGHSHLWSEAQSLSHILTPTTNLPFLRFFASYPVQPSNAPFRCCAVVKETSSPSVLSQVPVTEDKSNLQTHGNCTFKEREASKRGNIKNSTYAGSVGMLREITFQAPLILKNCLPLTVSLTVGSVAGETCTVCAPEVYFLKLIFLGNLSPYTVHQCDLLKLLQGDSVFIFEVNPAHDLTLSINISGFHSASTRFASSISLSELQTWAQEEEVRYAETLELIAVAPEGHVVYAKVEKLINLVCGARELSIYVPIWFYNLSCLKLGIIDGDIDSLLGKGNHTREQVIASSELGINGRDSLALDSLGLQNVLEMKTGDPTRISTHRRCCSPSVVRSFIGGKVFCEPRTLTALKDDKSDVEIANLKAHIYSPFRDEELSDKRVRIRILPSHSGKNAFGLGSSELQWSRPFLMIPPGGTTFVVVPALHGKAAYILSVVSASAMGACAGKTRTITFLQRFVLANTCSQDLCYKQQGTDTFDYLVKGGQTHLHWSDTSRPLLVTIRFDQHGWDWSGGFVPDQLGDTQLKVRNLLTGATHMLRVEIQNASFLDNNDMTDITNNDNSLGTYLIVLSDDVSCFMPYRIDNFSQERLRFYQLKCPNFETILLPYSSCLYSWDEPWRPHRLVLEIPGEGCLGMFDLDKVKEHPNAHLLSTLQKPERRFFISVHAEGPIRVLTFQDMKIHPKIPERGLTGSLPGQDHDMNVTDQLSITFSSIGVSIINSTPQEIAFVCARGIIGQFLQSPNQQKMSMNVLYIQVDNQLRHAQYPVMLSVGLSASTNSSLEGSERCLETPKHQTGENLEFTSEGAFTLIVSKWRHLAISVDCFQQIDVRIAQVQLQLDENIICSILEFFRSLFEFGIPMAYPPMTNNDRYAGFASVDKSEFLIDSSSSDLHFIKILRYEELFKSWSALEALKFTRRQKQKLLLRARGSHKVYIEALHVSPIEVTISFSSSSWLLNHRAAAQPLLWITGAKRGLMALVDVEGAPVRLRKLYLAHPLARWDAIRTMFIRHYTRQLLQELYKVFGYAGLLGNPIGFIWSLGSGVKDFVYAPARSFIQSPKQLVKGITQGTESLLSNTVFAVSNAATLMSRAAKKGVTAVALNHEYGVEMKRHQQAYTFQDYGVISELLEGLTGLLQSPVTGAQRHGIPGILSGVAVGSVGLVARPVASLLEVAGRTAQTIRSWSQPIRRQERRVRPPRYLSIDCPLLPYSWEEAIGNAVLVEAASSHLARETYIMCRPLAESGNFILLTELLLMKVRSTYLSSSPSQGRPAPEWTIDSEFALKDILHVETKGTFVHMLMASSRYPIRTKRTSKKRQRPVIGLFLHESLEMMQKNDAEKLASVVNYLLHKYFRGKPRFVIS